jgi:hypothetical protein
MDYDNGVTPSNGNVPIRNITGDEARRAFESLSAGSKYGQLEDRVVERGERLRPDEATVIRVDGDISMLIADIPIGTTEADEAHLCIGRNTETGEVLEASLEYDEQVDGETIEKTILDATAGTSFEETTQRLSPDTFRDLVDGP